MPAKNPTIMTTLFKPFSMLCWLTLIIISYFYLDLPLALWLQKLYPSFLYVFFHWVTILGSPWFNLGIISILAIITLFINIPIRFRKSILSLIIAIVVSYVAYRLLKVVFGRARPSQYFENHLYGFYWWQFKNKMWSFPSGHATNIGVTMTALSYYWPRYQYLFLLIVILVCFSRLVLEAHYLSDVLAGVFLGMGITALICHKWKIK